MSIAPAIACVRAGIRWASTRPNGLRGNNRVRWSIARVPRFTADGRPVARLPIGLLPSWPYPFRRFFARIGTATIACPSCDHVTETHEKGAYDRLTQCVTCKGCGQVWQLGIVAWRVKQGITGYQYPKDTRPDLVQSLDVRAQVTGFAVEERKRKGEPVNRALAAECTCGATPWAKDCPIHGLQRA